MDTVIVTLPRARVRELLGVSVSIFCHFRGDVLFELSLPDRG